jgi:hypothetical protein
MMTTITSQETTSTVPTINTIFEALQQLSPKYIPDILSFIQFLEYQSINKKEDNLELTRHSSRQVKIAGQLDSITMSNRTFKLITAEKQSVVKGFTQSIAQPILPTWLGKEVLISGQAYFTAGGKILTLEAEQITIATERDLEIWGQVPTPLYRPFQLDDFKVPQDKNSGMSAIYGKWPGNETDEEILMALEELS